MTINDIAKKTLATFKSRNYIFTPDEYFEAFCKEAKRANIIVEDCNKVSTLIGKLDEKYKKLLATYQVNTVGELAVFLVNNLNRENPTKDKEFINELLLYLKRALQLIAMLPFHELSQTAVKHLKHIESGAGSDEINTLRSEWMPLMTDFDEKVIRRLMHKCKVKEYDLFSLVESVTECLQKEPDFSELVEAIIMTLTPSYADFMNDEAALLKKQLKDNPDFITSKSFSQELETLTKKRIKLDEDKLKEKLKDIDSVAEMLSMKILNLLKQTEVSSVEIKEISHELRKVDFDAKDFDSIKDKLLTISISLDKEVKTFTHSLNKEEEEIKRLRTRVKTLEDRFTKLQKESQVDHLTQVYTKKALEDALSKQEEMSRRYKHRYSILFFDIDHFKNVNDTYGHDAGDVILKSMGLLLKKYSRTVDFIGRFGGEEFVAVLPETEKEGAVMFAEKIRAIVQKTKFMYKKTRIDITISIGVAERSESDSQEAILKLADERLYRAKQNGRNRVEST